MTMKRIRSNYSPGDRVSLTKNAPKYVIDIMKKNDQYFLEIKSKSYSGYSVNVVDPRQNNRVMQILDLPTKAISKGTIKAALIKAVEAKQSQLRKITEEYEREIAEMNAQLTLMDELGVEKIDEMDLEYAIKFSKSMGISIGDAYKALSINE